MIPRIIILFLLCASSLVGQTLVNFDAPSCSGNGVKTYQGIDFSLSPWDCERPNLAGDTTETISWYVNNTSGKFRFVTPSVLLSLRATSSASTGNIVITTDAGESVTIVAQPRVMPPAVRTGFTKAASVITVTYAGGWTIELDDLLYGSSVPTITSVTVSCSPLSVLFGGSSNCTAAVVGTGAFNNGVLWTASDGSISPTGVFSPPFVEESVGITATSVQDSTKSGIASISVAPLRVTFPGCCTIKFPISSASQVPSCTVADGVCDISIGICDDVGHCVVSKTGTLVIYKTITLPTPQTQQVTIAVASP